jgi:hypothetical protein
MVWARSAARGGAGREMEPRWSRLAGSSPEPAPLSRGRVRRWGAIFVELSVSGGQLGWGEPWLHARALRGPALCRVGDDSTAVPDVPSPCAMCQGDWVGRGGRAVRDLHRAVCERSGQPRWVGAMVSRGPCSLVEGDSRRQPPHRITHTPTPPHPHAASAARGADDRGWRWRWQEGAAHMTLRSGCRSLASVHRTSVRVGVCVWPVPCVEVAAIRSTPTPETGDLITPLSGAELTRRRYRGVPPRHEQVQDQRWCR